MESGNRRARGRLCLNIAHISPLLRQSTNDEPFLGEYVNLRLAEVMTSPLKIVDFDSVVSAFNGRS